jgi:vacuolar-type H+-ATPase subunit H
MLEGLSDTLVAANTKLAAVDAERERIITEAQAVARAILAGAERAAQEIVAGDLCHEAPTHAVTHASRSSATGSIDNSPGGFFLH